MRFYKKKKISRNKGHLSLVYKQNQRLFRLKLREFSSTFQFDGDSQSFNTSIKMTLYRSNEFRDNFDCNSWNDREIIRHQCFCLFFFYFFLFFPLYIYIYIFKRQNLKHNFYIFENIKGTQSYFFLAEKRPVSRTINGEKDMI